MTDQIQEPLEQINEDELDAAFADRMGHEPEEVASTEPSPDETPQDEPDESTPPQEQPAEPSETDPELENYRRFRQWAMANPESAEQIAAWQRGEVVMVPRQAIASMQQATQEPEVQPPGFYDDPEGYVRRLEQTVNTLQSTIQTEHQQRYQTEMSQNAKLLDGFVSEFRSKHPDLTDAQFDDLRQEVEASGWVLRGVQSHGDKARALREAFDNGYRVKFPPPSAQDMVQAQRQKRRAGAAASSPRPAQRQAPVEVPKNKQERLAAAADFIREHEAANS